MSIIIKNTAGRVLFKSASATDVRAAAVEAVNSGADLYGANLYGANLYGADLSGANLRNANLRNADLRSADLSNADLRNADLRSADLYGAKNTELAIATTSILPEGDLIGYKNCRNHHIVKLRIPAAAKRSNATSRKCRAEYAEVLEIINVDGTSADSAVSQHDPSFKYKVGATVRPTAPFDTDRWNECAAGIHFYITREEAQYTQ